MYCSGCGLELAPGQAFCPQCGRPVAPGIPSLAPVPNLAFQVESYRAKIRALAIAWFVYAGLMLLVGFVGLSFARHFLTGAFGPGMHGGGAPPWFFPMILRIAWGLLLVRSGLAVAAGWGMLEQAGWGRIVAIIAAFFSLFNFPFGTAIGIWTLVVLLGYRNAMLYEQL